MIKNVYFGEKKKKKAKTEGGSRGPHVKRD